MLKLAKVHYKVIIVIIALCLGYAYYDTRDAKPSFTSEATVEVSQKMGLVEDLNETDMRDTDILYTQVEKATSTTVMETVISISPWLQEYYEVDMEDVESVREAATKLSRIPKVKLRTDTLLIDISVTTGDKELSYQICEAVAEGIKQYNKDEKTRDIRSRIAGLEQQFESTKADLEAATQAFNHFINDGLSPTSMESRTADLEQLIRDEEKEKTRHDNLVSTLKRDYDRIVKLGFRENVDLRENLTVISNNYEQFIQIPSIYENRDFVTRLAALEQKEKIVKDLSAELLPAHPRMNEALTAVNNYKENVILAIADIPRFIKRDIAITELKSEDLTASIGKSSDELKTLRSKSLKHDDLRSEMETQAAYLERIRDNKSGAELEADNKPSDITVLEHARRGSPDYPNTQQTILLWLIAGLALSYGYIYLLNMMDQSIKSVEQAEQVLQLPVLAAVPAAEPDGQEIKNRLIMRGSSNSSCSEAFRSLRVNIESMNRSKSNKVVVFTSSMPSEGKTFTSINYAASLAQQGHKTLLIDMDLRKPAVGKDFDIEKSQYVGLTDVINSEEKLEQFPDLPMYEPTEGLFILQGGPLIDNPAERLSSYAVERIVEKAREHYDRVVIDSAPLGPVGDTLMVARLADMVCLVVRSAKTPSKMILRIIDTLHRHGHTPAGIVLNFMKIKSGYGSYYYYYSSDKEPEITSKKPPYKRKSNALEEAAMTPTDLAEGSMTESDSKKKQIQSEQEVVFPQKPQYTRRNMSVESHPSV